MCLTSWTVVRSSQLQRGGFVISCTKTCVATRLMCYVWPSSYITLCNDSSMHMSSTCLQTTLNMLSANMGHHIAIYSGGLCIPDAGKRQVSNECLDNSIHAAPAAGNRQVFNKCLNEEKKRKKRKEKKRQEKKRQEKKRQDKTRQDKTRQDKTRQDKTRQDKTRQEKKRKEKTQNRTE